MDLENKFSYHFLEGLTLTEDGILTQGNEQSLYSTERVRCIDSIT